MAFIKCPQCGQTALSIASVCPKCGHLLLQHVPPQGGDSTLGQCPRCRKFIDRHAPHCEFCGYSQIFWRRVRLGLLGALGVAVVTASIVGAIALRRSPAPAPVQRQVAAPSPPIPQPTVLPDDTMPPDTTAAEESPITAAPIVVNAPPSADTAQVTAPAPVDRVPTEDRWIVTWANLREGPGLDYPVVRVLLPGARIRVAAPSRGFSAVYGPAGLEGYVAVSLLSDRELPQDSLARVRQ